MYKPKSPTDRISEILPTEEEIDAVVRFLDERTKEWHPVKNAEVIVYFEPSWNEKAVPIAVKIMQEAGWKTTTIGQGIRQFVKIRK